MLLFLWSFDWYIYVLIILILYIFLDFLLVSSGFLNYINSSNLNLSLLIRNNYLTLSKLNLYYNKSLYILIIYILLGIILLLHYNYGIAFIYSIYQLISNNISLSYTTLIIWLFFASILGIGGNFYYYFNLLDIRLAYIMMFLLALLYFFMGNCFVTLFLIESQGVIIIYFLFAGHKYVQVYNMFLVTNIYNYYSLSSTSQFVAVFVQFFTAFLAALFFIGVLWSIASIYGSIIWFDILCLSYFNIIDMFWGSNYNFNIISLLFLLVISIKLGLFPFHFWNPILYRGISLWSMMIYMTFITILFILLFSLIYIYVFSSIKIFWYVLLYIFIIFSICIILNMFISISEFSIFLAYMSVFHMTYMLCFFLLNTYTAITPLLIYIYIYLVLILLFFFILIALKNLDIKFLTDFQNLFFLSPWNIIVLITLIFMSGIPPFIGFWANISVIICLLSINEIILMTFVLGSGFILMYFYLQNYRFFSIVQFSWYSNVINAFDNLYIIYIFIFIYSLLGLIQLYLLNDLSAICGVFNLFTFYYDYV